MSNFLSACGRRRPLHSQPVSHYSGSLLCVTKTCFRHAATSSQATASVLQPPSGTSSTAKQQPGVSPKINLDRLTRSVQLLSLHNFEWVDLTVDPEADASISADDGSFIAATRRALRKHNIPDESVSALSATEFWLPAVHVAPDQSVVSMVTRVVRPRSPAATVAPRTVSQSPISQSVPTFGADVIDIPIWLAETSTFESDGDKLQKMIPREKAAHGLGMERLANAIHVATHRAHPQPQAPDEDNDPANSGVDEDTNEGPMDDMKPVTAAIPTAPDLFPKSQLRIRSGTILDLTMRMTIFVHIPSRKIISLHRHPLPFVARLQQHWAEKYRSDTMGTLLYRLVRGTIGSFQSAEALFVQKLDALESIMFRDDEAKASLATSYALSSLRSKSRPPTISTPMSLGNRSAPPSSSSAFVLSQIRWVYRQSGAYVRVLREVDRAFSQFLTELRLAQAQQQLQRSKQLPPLPPPSPPPMDGTPVAEQHYIRAMQKHVQGTLFQWESLREQSQALLSLHVSVAVSRLEELLRVLTVFSTIFIPLEFLTALLGMNFVGLIEVESHPSAWWAVVAAMVITGVITQKWITRASFSTASVSSKASRKF